MRVTDRAWTSLMLLACVASWAGPQEERSGAASAEVGKRLFNEETFRGNGRVCATCHRPRTEFSITPELVQEHFRRDPTHPLFRPIDSNDGQGRDYSNLLEHAVVRVNIPLHDDVALVANPTSRTIAVWRGMPTISNLALTGPYLQDGRATTLQEQAVAAIEDHMQPGRKPLDKELDSIALYVRGLFYPLRLESLTDFGDRIPRPAEFSIPVTSAAAQRGRDVFNRHCLSCHGGETRERPTDPHQPRFTTVFVSEANRPGFSMLRLAFRNPDGSVTEVETPDPGRAAITGRLQDLNAFDIPHLRGLKHTAPYFHDNSAKTLGAMVDHYNEFFPFNITPAQKQDLLAYLELL